MDLRLLFIVGVGALLMTTAGWKGTAYSPECVKCDSLSKLPTETLLASWAHDSLGCEKIRTGSLFAEIERRFHFVGMKRVDVVRILGEPNRTQVINRGDPDQRDELEFYLRYFFDAACFGQSSMDEVEKCYFDFVIPTTVDSVRSIGRRCQ